MPPWLVVAFVAGCCVLALVVLTVVSYLERKSGMRRFSDLLSEEPSAGWAYVRWLAQYWWFSGLIAAAAAIAAGAALADQDWVGLGFGLLVAVGATVQALVLRSVRPGSTKT